MSITEFVGLYLEQVPQRDNIIFEGTRAIVYFFYPKSTVLLGTHNSFDCLCRPLQSCLCRLSILAFGCFIFSKAKPVASSLRSLSLTLKGELVISLSQDLVMSLSCILITCLH